MPIFWGAYFVWVHIIQILWYTTISHANRPYGHTGLTIKAIDLCNLPTLVVPPEQSDTIRILGLHTEQLGKCLQTIVASVHKITLEYTTQHVKQ